LQRHVFLGIKPELLDKLSGHTRALLLQVCLAEFEGSQESLLKIGDVILNIMSQPAIISIESLEPLNQAPDQRRDNGDRGTKKQGGADLVWLHPRCEGGSHNQDQGDGYGEVASLFDDKETAATTAEFLQSLSEASECWSGHIFPSVSY